MPHESSPVNPANGPPVPGAAKPRRRPAWARRRIQGRRLFRPESLEAMEPRVLLSVISWISDSSGNWSDPANWRDTQGINRVPGPGDDVVIDRPSADPTVTYDGGTTSINSLTSQDPLVLSGGTLSVTSTVQVNNTFQLSGGTLSGATIVAGTTLEGTGTGGTLDGVTLDGGLDMSTLNAAEVTVVDGLTLNGTVTLGEASGGTHGYLLFSGTQTLGGSGDVLLGSSSSNTIGGSGDSGSTLTIGPGVTVHGSDGMVGSIGYGLVNRGTIAADVAGGSIAVTGTGWINAGTIAADPGASVNLQGDSSLGAGDRFDGGGIFNLQGTLDSTGTILALDGSGTTLLLQGGTIRGGTVAATGGAVLMGWSYPGGTLDGVTLDGGLDMSTLNAAEVTVVDGLTLNGTVTLGEAAGGTHGYLLFSGTQTLGGTGDVLLGSSSSNAIGVGGDSGSTLTIGPGITVHGSGGSVGSITYGLVNRGTIAADVAGGSIAVTGTGWVNAGTIAADPGASVNLQGDSSLGAGDRFDGGGTFNLQGTLDSTGSTLMLDGSGTTLLLQGGTIRGGTVAATGGAVLMGWSYPGGTLDGVTLDGNLDMSTANAAEVTVVDGLTLNGTVTLGEASGGTHGYLLFSGTQTLGGTGNVVLGASSSNAIGGGDTGSTFTIGPGITVHGSDGLVGSFNDSLVNQGTIAADVAGASITVAGSSLTNSGTLRAVGGTMSLSGGDLIDSGTIAVGRGSVLQIEAGLQIVDPGLLAIDPAGEFDVSGDLTGDTRNADLFAPLGTVRLDGSSSTTPQHLEVMGQDLGNVATGFDRNLAYGTLDIATANVQLVDQSRNSAGTPPEALYVNTLILPLGDVLDLNGLHVYARDAQIDGTVVGGTVETLAPGGPLILGTPVPGNIQAQGQVDDWTFFGRANQSIGVVTSTGTGGVLSPLSPGVNYAQVQVVDPSGNVVATASNSQSGTDATDIGVVLPSDGVYHVRVQAAPGQPSSTGHYVLGIYDAPVHSTAVATNETVHGQTASAYALDRWTFSAAAGDRIRFDLIAADPLLRFDLAGPDGSALFTGASASSDLLVLPVSGTYTLTAHGASGAYAFRIDQTAQTALTPGTAYQGTLAGSAQTQLFTVNVATIEPLVVSFHDASPGGVTEVDLKYGSAPTRSDYDDRSTDPTAADQRIVVPSATPGTWYILVYTDSVPTPGTYTLTATTAQIELFGATPDHHGNGADAVLTLSGAGFLSGTSVSLIAGDGTAYPITDTSVDTLTQITATVKAGSVPPGLYSIRVTAADGTSAMLTDAFTMTQGGKAVLQTNIILPKFLANHVPATLYVQYSNTGDVAMPAPLLMLTATRPDPNGGPPVSGAELTLDSSLAVSGAWAPTLPVGYSTSVQFLASGATPGILQPGESIEIPVYYAGWIQSDWNNGVPTINFHLGVVKTDDTTPIDWNALQSASQPPGIATTAWQGVFASLQAQTGSTWGDYVQRLDDEARYLGTLGEDVTDVSRLYSFELLQADGLSTITQLGASVDASMPTPGRLSLSFGRFFTPSITGRNAMGPLGLGWSDSWQSSLAVQADGTVVVTEPGGAGRTFQPDVRDPNHYFDQAGDHGVLTPAGGGAFTLTEPDGTVTAYNADGTMDYVQDPNGNRITAGYTQGRLTSLTASSGQSLTIAYNAAGRIATVTDSAGRETAYFYDASATHLVSVTAFDGRQTFYTYDTGTNPATANALLSIANPDGTHTYYTYDAAGRFASTSADGGAEKTTFSYGPAGSVIATDAAGGALTIDFNDRGQLARTTDPLGRAVQYTYDDGFNLTQIIGPTGQVTQNRYDSSGNLIRTTDPLGHTTSFSYTSQPDYLASVTDANGNTTGYTYNGAGDLTSIAQADGSIKSLAYDPTGELTGVTNANGATIAYTRDASGRILSETTSDGSVTRYAYDTRGNMMSAQGPDGTTTFTYDTGDRLTRVSYPGGRYLQYTYDAGGRRIRMVDQDGFTVDYSYDSAGRLVALTDGAGAAIVTYTYDPTGRLARKDNGNGTFTTYAYDPAGDLLSLVNHAPDGSVTTRFDYTYSSQGLRTSETTADGTWTYTLDADGQLTHAVFASTNPAIPNQDLAYSYDAAGNRTSTVAGGVTTTYATDSRDRYTRIGGTTYAYDADGNLVATTDASGTTSYTYDALDRLSAVTTPDGQTWAFRYDALGNLTATTHDGQTTSDLIDPSGIGLRVAEYGASGNAVHYTYGLGLTSRVDGSGASYYDFNAVGSTSDLTGAAGEVLARYAYDPFGGSLLNTATISNPFQFAGQFGTSSDGFGSYYSSARYYDPALGRFLSPDPLGVGGDLQNTYRYANNDAQDLNDPTGLRDQVGQFVDGAWNIGEGVAFYGAIAAGEIGTGGAATPAAVVVVVAGTAAANYKIVKGMVDVMESFSPKDPGPGLPNSAAGFATSVATGGNKQATDLADNLSEAKDLMDGHNKRLTDFAPNPGNFQDSLGGFFSGFNPPGGQNSGTYSINSGDPNSLTGPAGYGSSHFVAPGTVFPYRIDFENASTATAPAQRVVITDPLDPHLDWNTLQLTGVGFGDTNLVIPPHSPFYQTTVPMTENGKSFNVEITISLDSATGVMTAVFQSIDPNTQLPPDALTGFLPPEDGTGRGMGYLSFLIDPRPGLPTGTSIRNVAQITFDGNPAVATDQVDDTDPTRGVDPTRQALNTIDAAAPTSSVSPLPGTTTATTFTVSWSGSDDTGGSGIGSYDVYVSTDGGPFNSFLTQTTATSAAFSGQAGHTYAFYSVATDNVGNVQATPPAPQTVTTIVPKSSPTPNPTPSPTPPVTVLGLQWRTMKVSRKKKVQVLVVRFSGPLDAGSASDLGAYRLVMAGKDRRFGTRDDRAVRLASASYNPGADTVTLTVRGKVPGKPLQLDIRASSILDGQGQPVDGGHDATFPASFGAGSARMSAAVPVARIGTATRVSAAAIDALLADDNPTSIAAPRPISGRRPMMNGASNCR